MTAEALYALGNKCAPECVYIKVANANSDSGCCYNMVLLDGVVRFKVRLKR